MERIDEDCLASSSSSSYYNFYVWSMYDDIRLLVARSYTSSADNHFSLISSFTLSNHLLLGHPLFLLPKTFISIALLPTGCSSLLITCPYDFNFLSWTFFAINSPTFVAPLILSFLIVSSFVTLHIHLNFRRGPPTKDDIRPPLETGEEEIRPCSGGLVA